MRHDPTQDRRSGRRVFHLHGREAISFNPFYTDDYIFDVEKKDSIKTLLLTLWKSEDDKGDKDGERRAGQCRECYIERIQSDRSIVPSFNTFYEYMRDDYRKGTGTA